MSEADRQDEFGARLAILGDRFRERTLADAGELERLGEALGRGGGPGVREDIRRIAHRLSGAAGTFGFPDLSKAAGDLEDLIVNGSPEPRIGVGTKSVAAQIRGRL